MRAGNRREHGGLATEPREHVLVTLLGTNPQPVRYALDERQVDARLAPVALCELLPKTTGPDRVLALCTREAERKTWPLLQEDLDGTVRSVECLIVPSGHTQEDVNEYLVRVCKKVSDGKSVELTVDVTHGFRHFSFLTYTAVLYLEALGIAEVRGAYYGLWTNEALSPFLDLRPLLALPQWVHAVRVLRDTGSAMPMAENLGDGPQSQSTQKIKKLLQDLSEAYLSGLPLELGRCAHDILDEMTMKPLRRLLKHDLQLPLTDELIGQLGDTLKRFALPQSTSEQGWQPGWKARIALSKEELERQAKVVDDLLRRGSVATALRLMNEWTISWTAWRLDENEKADWLDYHKVRRKAGNLLGAIPTNQESKTVVSRDQNKLGKFWRDLSDLRNAYAHNGMRRQVLLDRDEKVRKMRCRILKVWGELRSFPDWDLGLEDSGGRVLLSPIGMRPGVLFSALEVCRRMANGSEPSVCLVICSQDTDALIEDAITEAGFDGRIERIRINPHGSDRDIKEAVKIGRRHIAGADDVFVNVTGGTAVMGLATEALAVEARRLARPVRRFGLIDRRTPVEQDADPYRIGEPFWLDGGEEADANEN